MSVQSILSTTVTVADSSGTSTSNIGPQHVYSFGLLILAAILVCGQVWQVWHPAPSATDDTAKEKMKSAADLVVAAANTVKVAATKTTTAADATLSGTQGTLRLLNQTRLMNLARLNIIGSPHPPATADVDETERKATEANQAAAQAATTAEHAAAEAHEASTKAQEAKDEVEKNTSLTDVVNTVAGKLPLVGGAIVFALLGAWVGGWITISFGPG